MQASLAPGAYRESLHLHLESGHTDHNLVVSERDGVETKLSS